MKQSYEDFVKELEELWTDENIKDVLDYMGIEYRYITPVNDEYHVSENKFFKSDFEINGKSFVYKIEEEVPEEKYETKDISYNHTKNVAPMKLKLQAA